MHSSGVWFFFFSFFWYSVSWIHVSLNLLTWCQKQHLQHELQTLSALESLCGGEKGIAQMSFMSVVIFMQNIVMVGNAACFQAHLLRPNNLG